MAELINTMMTHQQSPESIKTIHNKWLRPENIPHLVTPTVNKDIWDVLPQDLHYRDIKFQKIQSQVVKGITLLLNLGDSEEDGEKRGTMMAAITLLSNACMELNILRKQEMKGGMKKWKGLVNKSVSITHQLFGNDTEGGIKKIRAAGKITTKCFRGFHGLEHAKTLSPLRTGTNFQKKGTGFFRTEVAEKQTRLPVAATIPKQPVLATPTIPVSNKQEGEEIDPVNFGGRIRLFTQKWKEITSDTTILDMIEGVK